MASICPHAAAAQLGEVNEKQAPTPSGPAPTSTPAPAPVLTPEQIAIVKATAPVLKQHGTTITSRFYSTLLAANPQLKSIFSLRNQQTGLQQAALADAVVAYAYHIDNLPVLTSAVERIAQKHVSLQVQPEQYAVVGQFLLAAVADVLGDACTPEIAAAWQAAYAVLAGVFIKREEELYVSAEDEDGGWRGWREFTIARREAVSDVVSNFYFAPKNGGRIASFKPGQYISVRVRVPQAGNIVQLRQYSLSEAPSTSLPANEYRISVKREHTFADAPAEDVAAGKVPGIVSNVLFDRYKVGDTVELSHPRGDFFVDVKDEGKADVPLVLISAGVGATPLMSILREVKSEGSAHGKRPVSWVHVAKNPRRACFVEDVRALQGVESRVIVKFAGRDADGQRAYDGVDENGLDLDRVRDVLRLDDARTEYLICGQEEWMKLVRNELLARGVAKDHVALEVFRTGTVGE